MKLATSILLCASLGVAPVHAQSGEEADPQAPPTQAKPTQADDPPPPLEALTPDVEELRAQLRLAEELPAVNEQRGEIVRAYTEAITALEEADGERAAAERYQQRAAIATERIAALERDAAAAADAAPSIADFADLGLEALEARETQLELESVEANRDLEAAEARLRALPVRRADLSREVSEAESRAAARRTELAELNGPEGGSALAAAIRARVAALVQLSSARVERLRVEEVTAEPRLALLTAEVELARIVAEHASARRAMVEELVNRARIAAAEAEAARALDADLRTAEALSGVVETIDALRARTIEVARELEALRRIRRGLRESLEALEDRFTETKTRLESPGLTEASGLRLRRERRALGGIRSEAAAAEVALNDRVDAELELYRLSDKLEELAGRVGLAEELAERAEEVDGLEPERALLAARTAVDEYRSALDRALEERQKVLAAYDELDLLRAEFAATIDQVDAYVAERVLWIRSADPLWRVRVAGLREEAARGLAPAEWAALARALVSGRDGGGGGDLGRRPWTYLGLALLVAALITARVRLGRMLAEEAALALDRKQTSILPTLRALLISIPMAAPWGALLYGLAWLARTVDPAVLPENDVLLPMRLYALGEGLAAAAVVAWVVGGFRVLTRPDGLAISHFDWPEESTRRVRKPTFWLLPVAATAAFLAHFLAGLESGQTSSTPDLPFDFALEGLAFSEGFSRVAFLVMVAAFVVYHVRTLHPARGILAINVRSAVPNDVVASLRRTWFGIGIALLTVLAAASVFGYGFTARSLLTRLLLTVAFLVAVLVARGVALRWTRLVRRREAFERMRRRREEQRAKRLAEIERRRDAGEDVDDLEASGLQVEDEQVDVAALSADVLGLVRVLTGVAAIVGVFVLWSAVLPALGIFDEVHLWRHDVLTSAIDGASDAAMSVTVEWVTLENLLVALLVLGMTWLAVRDVPSLVEFVVLRRMDLGSGERYAITTLTRYTLTMIGLVWGFSELGISWSKLQWLVAGVSVGLGFGLQEIFANFVSGITLLFERPVRVGDWVTLGDIEGVVSKIRIRATTIRDRDLKELIVPNREFITGRFINWTLSDPVSRIVAPVGIAYGSDTERAIQLLLEVGKECPFSVAEPAPNVVFSSFGESSLDFELRVFVAGREIKPRVLHDLHMRIDAAFRAADIEIAFPQRDLHVRSVRGWPGGPVSE